MTNFEEWRVQELRREAQELRRKAGSEVGDMKAERLHSRASALLLAADVLEEMEAERIIEEQKRK